MIAPWTMFAHTAVLLPQLESGATTWAGRAKRVDTRYAGLVGSEPLISIAAGRITLESIETNEELDADPDTPFSEPVADVSFEIGPIVEDLLAPGDEIRVQRGGMRGLSVLLRRDGELIFAVGTLCYLTEGEQVVVGDDPRTAFEHDFDLANLVQHHNPK
jgi:hypothetical protein